MLLNPIFNISLNQVRDFIVTIPSGKVSSDLTDFPVLIDLSDMPSNFWNVVSYGGYNLRAFELDGITQLPLDIISCLTSISKGAIAVKVDVASSSDTEFIIRCQAGALRLNPEAPYGRNEVWSDYEAVIAGGKDFQNRTGKSLSRVWGYPQGFELISTSGTITGHEGVVGDGSTFVVIGSNALRKYNSTFSTILDSNLDPAGDAGVTDCGGGCYYDGKIYLTVGAPQKVAIFDYATLNYISSFDISVNASGAGGLEINPEDGLIYTIVYDSTSPYPLQMHKYDPSDGSYEGAVTLTTQSGTGIANAQGIIWHKGAFYIPVDTVSRYYKVEPTGKVVEGGEFGITGATVEDGFSDGDSIYNFMQTSGENGYVQRWRPFVDDLGGSMRLTADGRVNMPISISSIWSMRAFGRRFDNTTRVIAALNQGGANLGNGMNVAWVSGALRAAFDTPNGALNFGSPPAPDTNTDFMIHVAYDGTTARHAWYNGGSKVTDSVITARGADCTFMTVGGERETSATNSWRGRTGLCYLREGILSDAWVAAEFANFNDPAFYSISESP
jgi:hypothetical protein